MSMHLPWSHPGVQDRWLVSIPSAYYTAGPGLNLVQHKASLAMCHDCKARGSESTSFTLRGLRSRLTFFGFELSSKYLRGVMKSLADLGLVIEEKIGREYRYTLDFSSGTHKATGYLVNYGLYSLDKDELRAWTHSVSSPKISAGKSIRSWAKDLGIRWPSAKSALRKLYSYQYITVVNGVIETPDVSQVRPSAGTVQGSKPGSQTGHSRIHARTRVKLKDLGAVDNRGKVRSHDLDHLRSESLSGFPRPAGPRRAASRQTNSHEFHDILFKTGVEEREGEDAQSLRSLRQRSGQEPNAQRALFAAQKAERKGYQQPWSAFDHQPLESQDPRTLLERCPWTAQIGFKQIDLLLTTTDLNPKVFAQILTDMFTWLETRPYMNRPLGSVLRWVRDPRNIQRAAKATGVSDPTADCNPEFASEVEHLAGVQNLERKWLAVLNSELPSDEVLVRRFKDGHLHKALYNLIDLLKSAKSGKGSSITKAVGQIAKAVGHKVRCSTLGLAQAISGLEPEDRWALTKTQAVAYGPGL